jgi:hypothetical protein
MFSQNPDYSGGVYLVSPGSFVKKCDTYWKGNDAVIAERPMGNRPIFLLFHRIGIFILIHDKMKSPDTQAIFLMPDELRS